MKRLLGIYLVLGALISVSPGCYTLSGSVVPKAMTTIHIDFFENDAPIVVSNLSQIFTEALKERIRSTTSISIVAGEGKANMSGAIVGYSYAPVSIQASDPNKPPIANAEVLTITVKVKFVYDADKKLNFDQTFTKTVNFTGDINSQEQNLIKGVVKQLIDDIFNKAFNNW
ncbi:LptE family protein [Mucilaginibacter sp. UR6-11]|uniref:LptE family protein n=1 Tax=Mucilaginibacter sp. UR6-11 TaxID=1435644 RepID=UPI001E28F330|nr:LptE family protein [Mucilaginibacter sp. UR6-11]MCC8425213.1 LPS assembly lipoprotein LptE [Mucilaginibacter sp. UR6-11]